MISSFRPVVVVAVLVLVGLGVTAHPSSRKCRLRGKRLAPAASELPIRKRPTGPCDAAGPISLSVDDQSVDSSASRLLSEDDLLYQIGCHLDPRSYYRLASADKRCRRILDGNVLLQIYARLLGSVEFDLDLGQHVARLPTYLKRTPAFAQRLQRLELPDLYVLYDRLAALITAFDKPEPDTAWLVQYNAHAERLFADLNRSYLLGPYLGLSLFSKNGNLFTVDRELSLPLLKLMGTTTAFLDDLCKPRLLDVGQLGIVQVFIRHGLVPFLFDRDVMRILLSAGLRLHPEFVLYSVKTTVQQLEHILPLYNWTLSYGNVRYSVQKLKSMQLMTMSKTKTKIDVFWRVPMIRDYFRSLIPALVMYCKDRSSSGHYGDLLQVLKTLRYPWSVYPESDSG